MKELLNLQIGKRYTVIRQNDMGFIFASHVEITGIKNEPYAQYGESIRLVFKLKGKRNLRQMRFLPHNLYLVWEGWLAVNTEMYIESSQENRFTVQKSLRSFDPEYFERAKRSVSHSPIIEYSAH